MANYKVSVTDVLSNFYNIKPDDEVRGLYEVRDSETPDGEILWYYFTSNNATYHSSGYDCVIRDINQANSGYIDRLKRAFEKAKESRIKIFWLVLVFGDGINLPYNGYNWMASVELLVDLDSITGSLSMRNYPQGQGREGYLEPCYIRMKQDRYFNTTFISCKDADGNLTKQYMEDYFKIYDNRPYHDIITAEAEEEIQNTEDTEAEEERLTGAENILLYGVPGSGKSHTIKEEYCQDERYIERVVFHPDYTYSDFVGQILPRVNDGGLRYEFTAGPFTSMLKKAVEDGQNRYYLIIEEINRGNAPAIFGEIFQLLDRKSEDDGYPATEIGESEYGISNYDVALKVYNNAEHQVKIPSNMYILATMNTADQNVFTLDTAFQRRWDMRQIKNDVQSATHALDLIDGSTINWAGFAMVINDMIVNGENNIASTEDKRLGAYFIKKRELVCDKFAEKVLKYLWDDAFKMERELIFKDEYKSLENIINAYKEDKEDKLRKVLKDEVYRRMQTTTSQISQRINNEAVE